MNSVQSLIYTGSFITQRGKWETPAVVVGTLALSLGMFICHHRASLSASSLLQKKVTSGLDGTRLKLLPKDILAIIIGFLSPEDIRINPSFDTFLDHRVCKRYLILRHYPSEIIHAIGLDVMESLPLIDVPGENVSVERLEGEDWERAQEPHVITERHDPKKGYSLNLHWKEQCVREQALDPSKWRAHIPPTCWAHIKGPGEKVPCALIHYLTSEHLQQKSIALFFDAAGRFGIAFNYLCTYKKPGTDKINHIQGVAALHQARADKRDPWVWVDNIAIDVSSAKTNGGVSELGLNNPDCRWKRWFLFHHVQKGLIAPDCAKHYDWLARFVKNEKCGWLLLGEEGNSIDDLPWVQIAHNHDLDNYNKRILYDFSCEK